MMSVQSIRGNCSWCGREDVGIDSSTRSCLNCGGYVESSEEIPAVKVEGVIGVDPKTMERVKETLRSKKSKKEWKIYKKTGKSWGSQSGMGPFTRMCHTIDDMMKALEISKPGDVILLDEVWPLHEGGAGALTARTRMKNILNACRVKDVKVIDNTTGKSLLEYQGSVPHDAKVLQDHMVKQFEEQVRVILELYESPKVGAYGGMPEIESMGKFSKKRAKMVLADAGLNMSIAQQQQVLAMAEKRWQGYAEKKAGVKLIDLLNKDVKSLHSMERLDLDSYLLRNFVFTVVVIMFLFLLPIMFSLGG